MADRNTNIIVRLRDQVSTRLQRIGEGFGRVTARVAALGAAAVAVGAVLGARFLGGALRSAADFEEQMSRVQGVTQASAAELDLLKTAAEDAGATTRFTATEAAQGLEELTRAGQTAREAVQSLTPTLQVAQANNIEVARSAEIVTDALNQFGLAAEQTNRVADVLTRTGQVSATNIELLGAALAKVAPVASQAGLSIEQTSAILGRFADFGFRGEEAGTAFRNALLDFQNPASQFRAALDDAGIVTDDFVTALEQIEQQGGNAEAILRTLGRRGVAPFTALLGGSIDRVRALEGTLNNAGGTAERTAAQMDGNLRGALLNLGSAFDAFRRAVAEPILQPLQNAALALGEQFRTLADSDQVQRFADRLALAIARATESIVSFVGNLDFDAIFDRASRAVTTFVSALSSIGGALATVARVTAQWAEALKIAVAGLVVGRLQSWGAAMLSTAAGTRGAAAATQTFGRALRNLGIGSVAIALLDLAEKVRELQQANLDAAQAQEDAVAGQRDVVNAARQALDASRRQILELGDGIENLNEATLQQLDNERQRLEILARVQRAEAVLARSRGADASSFQAENQRLLASLEQVNARIAEVRAAVGNVSAGSDIPELTDGVDEAAAAYTRLQQQIAAAGQAANQSGLDQARADLEALKASGEITAQQYQQLAAEVDAAAGRIKDANLASQFDPVAPAAQTAAFGIRDVGAAADETAQQVGGIGSVIAGALESVRGLSAGAAREVDQLVAAWERSGQRTPIAAFRQLGDITRQVSADFRAQAEEADALIESFDRSGGEAFNLGRAIQLVRDDISLLDQARLDRLQSAIASTKDRADALNDSIRRNIADLEQQIAIARGADAEQVAFERRRAEIQEQLRNARGETRDLLREELRLLEDARKAEANRADSAERTADARRDSAGFFADQSAAADDAEREARAAERAAEARARSSSGVTRAQIDVNVRATGGTANGLELSRESINDLAEQLTPIISRLLADEQRLQR